MDLLSGQLRNGSLDETECTSLVLANSYRGELLALLRNRTAASRLLWKMEDTFQLEMNLAWASYLLGLIFSGDSCSFGLDKIPVGRAADIRHHFCDISNWRCCILEYGP